MKILFKNYTICVNWFGLDYLINKKCTVYKQFDLLNWKKMMWKCYTYKVHWIFQKYD